MPSNSSDAQVFYQLGKGKSSSALAPAPMLSPSSSPTINSTGNVPASSPFFFSFPFNNNFKIIIHKRKFIWLLMVFLFVKIVVGGGSKSGAEGEGYKRGKKRVALEILVVVAPLLLLL